MKTLAKFEKQQELGFDEWLKPMNQIDEQFYYHIVCGYVAPNFDGEVFGQNGECNREEHGIRFYETVMRINGKYYYLGECPSMNPDEYNHFNI